MDFEHKTFSPSSTSYSQAYQVSGQGRILFVSGQVPSDESGGVPSGFEGQCRLAWKNLVAQLSAANMSVRNIAKLNIFLASRDYRQLNTEIRHEILSGHAPAITVVIADIFDESWLVEIDAIACS